MGPHATTSNSSFLEPRKVPVVCCEVFRVTIYSNRPGVKPKLCHCDHWFYVSPWLGHDDCLSGQTLLQMFLWGMFWKKLPLHLVDFWGMQIILHIVGGLHLVNWRHDQDRTLTSLEQEWVLKWAVFRCELYSPQPAGLPGRFWTYQPPEACEPIP